MDDQERLDGPGQPPLIADADARQPAPAERARSWSPAVENVTNLIQTVGAPAGLVTGFLVFFGSTYTGAYYEHFGIAQGLLQYSLQNQVLQSVRPMFGTAILVLAVACALWVLDRAATPLRRRSDRVGRWTRTAILAAGLLAGLTGLLVAVGFPRAASLVPPRAAALALLAGALSILLIRRHVPGSSPERRAERLLLVVVSVIALFWVATVYASEAGSRLAADVEESPGLLPLATLFSGEYLDLPGSTVTFEPNRSSEGGSLYRYTGLRLLTYSADRWFLVGATYEGYRPAVTVLPDRAGLRVEIVRQK